MPEDSRLRLGSERHMISRCKTGLCGVILAAQPIAGNVVILNGVWFEPFRPFLLFDMR